MDKRIQAVIILPAGLKAPLWAKVQEVRDAILDFRKSGKPAVAYLEYGGDREYYLATACRPHLPDADAPLDLNGVATYEVFLRGTLDKIGALSRLPAHRRLQDGRQHVHREGLHAGAPGDDRVAEHATSTISSCAASPKAGKKTEAEVRALIDQGPFLPEDALRAGLVDDLAYEDQVDDKLQAAGRQAARASRADDYAQVHRPRRSG